MATTPDDLPAVFVHSPSDGILHPVVSGRYRHMRRSWLKKDVFYCSANGFYMYALSEDMYGISRRLGSTSAVVKILSSDIMIGECLVFNPELQDYVKYEGVDIWLDGDTGLFCDEGVGIVGRKHGGGKNI